ncbi:Com family DNA-binding transcriptional regulator [Pseudomonas aestusnigri]|nr:Com family DNA-binding transcriptional regulator [Halopseudomonas aestusnigri]
MSALEARRHGVRQPKVGQGSIIEIKCPRCGTLNQRRP